MIKTDACVCLLDLNKTGEGCTKLEILLYILRKFKPKVGGAIKLLTAIIIMIG